MEILILVVIFKNRKWKKWSFYGFTLDSALKNDFIGARFQQIRSSYIGSDFFWRVLSVSSRTAWALQILDYYVMATSDSEANISFTDQKTPGRQLISTNRFIFRRPSMAFNLFDITLINRVFESFSWVYMRILSRGFEKFHFWVDEMQSLSLQRTGWIM